MAAVFVYTMMNAILLLYSCLTVEGRVTTTLPEVATVCNGSQFELNCTITGHGSILEWGFIPEQNHSQLSAIMYSPIINRSLPYYGDSTITFTVISHPMELILHIMTVISPVTNILNGTVVKCTDVDDRESPSLTVISVVNDQDFESIIVRAISEDFNRDNAEVSLEWVPDSSFHTYHVNITPQPAFSMTLKRNSIHLKIEYNLLYNVSIVTVSPCGQTLTINEILYYVNCGHPFQDVDNDSVIIEGYMDPSLEGTVLSFDCPPQHVLIGPNTTTCMGNGEWEPDPREVECKGIMLGLDRNNTQDLESRTSHEILTAAVSSSVVAFLVILTSATGVACGYYFMRRRRRKQSSSSSQPMEPLYDDVILPQTSAVEQQEQGLELKENMAYGTAKPTDPLHEDMNAHQE